MFGNPCSKSNKAERGALRLGNYGDLLHGIIFQATRKNVEPCRGKKWNRNNIEMVYTIIYMGCFRLGASWWVHSWSFGTTATFYLQTCLDWLPLPQMSLESWFRRIYCIAVVVILPRRFWLVRFLHPRFNDRRALVPEQGLSFGYCVMQLVKQFQVACYSVAATNSWAFHES